VLLPLLPAASKHVDLPSEAMRKLHFDQYTFRGRSVETAAVTWGIRVRAYHIYSCAADGRMPIMLYRTWDDEAPRYDLSNAQKFVISVARALRRPHKTASIILSSLRSETSVRRTGAQTALSYPPQGLRSLLRPPREVRGLHARQVCQVEVTTETRSGRRCGVSLSLSLSLSVSRDVFELSVIWGRGCLIICLVWVNDSGVFVSRCIL